MKPSIGRIVCYHCTEVEQQILNHGQEFAVAVITAVWSDTCVNLRLLWNGPHADWLTSRNLGEERGAWKWPERV